MEPYSNLNLAIRDFASFESCYRVSNFLIFVIRENEFIMSVNHDPLFFRFVNCARDHPLNDPLCSLQEDSPQVWE